MWGRAGQGPPSPPDVFLILTPEGSRYSKQAVVCNANPSNRADMGLLPGKAQTQMVTLLLTPDTLHANLSLWMSVAQTLSPAKDRVKEKEAEVWLGVKRRGCLPVKVFWVSDTLKTSVNY